MCGTVQEYSQNACDLKVKGELLQGFCHVVIKTFDNFELESISVPTKNTNFALGTPIKNEEQPLISCW